MTHAQRADTMMPYGDVEYADPGYQSDGQKRYPLDSEEHCRAAWSYINMAKNAAKYSPEHLAAIKAKIRAAGKKYGIEFSDDSSSRFDYTPLPFVRSFALDDISIRTGAGEDGRTVDAYAAVFDVPVPIHDQDGDYIEVIDRRAFNRAISDSAPSGGRTNWRVGVFYNHGMTIHGTPSDVHSLPIGVPLEIKVDGRGLFTRTRYGRGEIADRILESIKDGSIAGYSFSGAFRGTSPLRPRSGFRPDARGNLPTVRRTESTLREYGPTPFPAYREAEIVGVRAEQITEQLNRITEMLQSGAPLDSPQFSGAPAWDSPPEDSPVVRRSARSLREEMARQRSAFLQRYGSE